MKVLTLSATLGVLMVASISPAQGVLQTGLSPRIGAFMPTSSSARDLSKTWIAFGVDGRIESLKVKAPGVNASAYVGYSADFFNHGSTSNVPIALNYNVRFGQFVYAAGTGLDFYNLDKSTSSGIKLGVQASVSYDLHTGGMPVFLQAKYFGAGKKELNGFALYVGVRF